MKLNQIICGDCLEVMPTLEKKSFDLIITSPPYNLRNSTGGFFKQKDAGNSKWKSCAFFYANSGADGYDQYDDNIPEPEYIDFMKKALSMMFDLLTDKGAIYLNFKWRVQGGLLQDRREFLEGLPLRQIIIWDRLSGFNFNDAFYCPVYEVIYLIAKENFKLKYLGCRAGNVWRIKPDYSGINPHPAPFPLELPAKILATAPAKRVLDPFCGSGTTCIACVNAGVDFLGIEQSQKYVDLAYQRLRDEAMPPAGFKSEFGRQQSLF